MREIKYCQKCHQKKRKLSYPKAQEQIQKVSNEEIIIDDLCTSTCGPGKNYVAYDNEQLIISKTFESLIKNIKENNEN